MAVPQKLKLNVGGQSFVTTLSTLSITPYFARRFAPENASINQLEGGEDSYFVDRDPDAFKYILRGMRHQNVSLQLPNGLDMSQAEWEQELVFYGIVHEIVKQDDEVVGKKRKRLNDVREKFSQKTDILLRYFSEWISKTITLKSCIQRCALKFTINVTFGVSLPKECEGMDFVSWYLQNVASSEYTYDDKKKQKEFLARKFLEHLNVTMKDITCYDDRGTPKSKKETLIETLTSDGNEYHDVSTKQNPIVSLRFDVNEVEEGEEIEEEQDGQ